MGPGERWGASGNRASPGLLLFVAVVLFLHGGVRAMEDKEGGMEQATFAGGCFWCLASDFEGQEGVLRAVSGYTGGHVENPTYEEVCRGDTGHLEAVQVTYDPRRIAYADLLEVFWRHIDPTDPGGQFVDRGPQYATAIFFAGESQKQAAEASKEALGRSGRFRKPIATRILPLGDFYPAEDYHQDYHRKDPARYRQYRMGSGRDRFLEATWGRAPDTTDPRKAGNPFVRPTDAVLRQTLTPLQYEVTRRNGTEPPFQNAYWDHKEEGIYVEIVSGEPLFGSRDKFDSGTGWPSFTRPLEPGNIVEKTDRSLFMERTEVRSRIGDSHLGHVFSDGPPPTGRRYCINSAALRFVPVADLSREGYERYRGLFPPSKPEKEGKDPVP